jgi:hypothetical protein
VKDAVSFAEEAFDLEIAFQVSWKATPEGIMDELESRFAPEHYVDHELSERALTVTCESDHGQRRERVPGRGANTDALIGTVARLVNLNALALLPLNDGDDLHYVFVDAETKCQLEKILGRKYATALRPAR